MKQRANYFFLLIIIFLITPAIIFLIGFRCGTDSDNKIEFSKTDNGESEIINMNKKTGESKKKDSSVVTDYMTLHYDALLIDTHNDFVWKVFDKGAEFGKRNSFTQSDLYKMKDGGIDVQVFAVWIPMNQVKRSYSFTMEQIKRLKQFETGNPDEFEFAKNYDDIIRITGEKKLCGLIGIEGGTAIENDIDNIDRFFEMGVRYIGLTWNNSNKISTSAKDAAEKNKQGGLTEFGKQVVRRMNETGMLVDVSHLSEAGFRDVIEISTSPIIASHSDCYAINPHFRNLTDEQIMAIAKNGGYIGINFYDEFLDKDGKQNGTTLDKVIEHIDHIKNLVGADYIGIGSDFDGGISPPKELEDVTKLPLLTKKLLERGYTPEEIKKIYGENFLRVFKKVCK